MTAVVVTMGVVLALVIVLLAGLLRSHADILRALHALGITEEELRGESPPPGSSHSFRTRDGVPEPRLDGAPGAATDVTGATPTGGAVSVAVVGVAHTTLLAFLSSGCLTCRDFWQAFGGDLRLPGDDTRLVIVTQGSDAESPAAVAGLAPRDVPVVMSSSAWSDYAVPVSPYFLLVDGPSGEIIGEGAAASWDKVAELLDRALADTGRGAVARHSSRERTRGSSRQADTDAALLAAGIRPGDPRLHHLPAPDAAPPRATEGS